MSLSISIATFVRLCHIEREREREIMLFIGKPIERSIMISIETFVSVFFFVPCDFPNRMVSFHHPVTWRVTIQKYDNDCAYYHAWRKNVA